GDSFWTIAEETVSDALARPATDDEVDPYWRRLVEANRARLVDPADPDLLHPGQVLELPPLSGR
ncbi:MAG: LysM peptidoglycan-binding domain-containing protein, partial [Acidimicrobiia bacterium]